MATQTETGIEPSTDASAETFGVFFLETNQALFGALWLVTRNRHEAEEIAQDAYLKVWERWDRVRRLDDPTGYLHRTAMNAWRSRGRRAALAIRHVLRPAALRDDMADVDARDAVISALAVLTPRQRAAIVLTDLLDMTSEDAAKALGVRPSTVRVLSARARTSLRERLEP
jgi:RNA polymerase sigma-70 factor (ECF subfamily)